MLDSRGDLERGQQPMTTAEQRARDLLTRLEHPRAQDLTAGDVVELANLIAYARSLQEAMHAIYQAMRDDEKGEWWTLRKWLNDRGIYNGDIGDHRLIEEVCRHVLGGAMSDERQSAGDSGAVG
jgi:hypothetical protein